MKSTQPSKNSWSHLRIKGDYSGYDTEKVRRDLQAYFPESSTAKSKDDEDNIEPWRMTRLAYQKMKAKVRVAGGVPVLDAADGGEHKRLVREALERGAEVPDKVLEDYPDLVPTRVEIQAVFDPEGDRIYRARIEGNDDWKWERESNDALKQTIVEEVGGITTLYQPALHQLQYGDDGTQVYFIGAKYALENPYTYHDEKQYAVGGWSGYFHQEAAQGWEPVELDSSNPYEVVGASSLMEVTRQLEGAENIVIELMRRPRNLPDAFPMEPETLTESEAREILEETFHSADNPAQTLTSGVLDAMERVTKANVVPDSFEGLDREEYVPVEPDDSFKERAEDMEAQLRKTLTEAGVSSEKQREILADVEKKANSEYLEKLFQTKEATEPTELDQAEFEQWELHLLTGMVSKRSSSFYQALKEITRSGTLRLAMEQINGDKRRCELIEERLQSLRLKVKAD